LFDSRPRVNEVASPIGYLYRRKVTLATDGFSGAEAMKWSWRLRSTFKTYDGTRPESNLRFAGDAHVPQRKEEPLRHRRYPQTRSLSARRQEFRFRRSLAGGPTKTAKMPRNFAGATKRPREELAVDFQILREEAWRGLSQRPPLYSRSKAKTLAYGPAWYLSATGAVIIR
jgi:hypothetical protein